MDSRQFQILYADTDGACRWQRITSAIETGMQTGRLRPGDALPTQRELAAALGLTTGTVTRGYAEAMRRGLTTAVPGRGTFISSERQDRMPLGVETVPPRLCPSPEDGAKTNLGFIAPFDYLDPPLHQALANIAARLSSAEAADLQTCRRPAGLDRHREAGSLWARRYGVPAAGRDLLICAGAQHALMVTLISLCSPADRVAVESLSYPLIRHLAWRLRLGLAPIRTDIWGMLPDALESACRNGGIRAVYLMPSCRNPTLTHMPARRRQEITEVCRRHNVLIIEDDVYALTAASEDATPPFAVLAPERTCFIAATSEILGGGLRIAYLIPPQEYFDELERTVSYTVSMVPPLMAELASQWIADGTADRVLAAKNEEAALRNAAARTIFDGRSLMTRNTGYFCWLPLPETIPATSFVAEAARQGVIVAGGSHFMMGHAPQENGIRIALGGQKHRQHLTDALHKLAALLESDSCPPGGACGKKD